MTSFQRAWRCIGCGVGIPTECTPVLTAEDEKKGILPYVCPYCGETKRVLGIGRPPDVQWWNPLTWGLTAWEWRKDRPSKPPPIPEDIARRWHADPDFRMMVLAMREMGES